MRHRVSEPCTTAENLDLDQHIFSDDDARALLPRGYPRYFMLGQETLLAKLVRHLWVFLIV